MEMPLIMIVMAVNIFQINPIFIVVAVLDIIFMVLYFWYCKRPTLTSKELDLKSKTPLFNSLNEMAAGLVSLRIYHQKANDLKKFAKRVNQSFQANISFWFVSRIFGLYLSYVSNLIVLFGLLLGLYWLSRDDGTDIGLYGVSAVFLIQINDLTQWFLRQLLSFESLMVSAERSFKITKLQS